MISAVDLTKAIESALINDTLMIDVVVDRSKEINFDPNRMPWIGIYPGTVETDPRCIGSGARRWEEIMQPILVLQAIDYGNEGTDAADALEELIKSTISVLIKDLTFGLSHTRLLRISRTYSYVQDNNDEEGGLFFPECKITLEVKTG